MFLFAVGVGFEPTVLIQYSSFQDYRLRPLGHPTIIYSLNLWTYGELNPGLIHAMDMCYRYTIGPLCGRYWTRTSDLYHVEIAL